jgi:prolyl oligopeptidase
LADQVRSAVEDVVYPAFRTMLEFLREYLTNHARREPGVWSVTDGPEIYALLTRQHTTSDLKPEELHQIGLDDLQHIHAEMRAIIEHRGAGGTPIREFTEGLTRDPANLPTSRDELIQISEQLLATAQAALPRAFGRLPSQPIAVKSVEEYHERDAPAAYYFPGAPDGSRPAYFYINTFEPSSRPKHTLPALAFHEGVPGHHLQIALAQEAGDLPAFRRLSAGWLANAFVEGWALYTERLADELELYPDELARYGMLGYQAWRACRLVVDTGLHHLRWSREQAIEFFFENVGLTERETLNEVDRYIVWPGQALAYKVGQREIEALRKQQQQRSGERFDLRAFHDAILGHAAVPLSTLRLILNT